MDLSLDVDGFRWARRGARRKRIMAHMDMFGEPATPMNMARALKISLHKISQSLSDLQSRQLVRILNPRAAQNRRYLLTAQGRLIIRRLNETKRI